MSLKALDDSILQRGAGRDLLRVATFVQYWAWKKNDETFEVACVILSLLPSAIMLRFSWADGLFKPARMIARSSNDQKSNTSTCTSYETRQCWWATERAPAVNPLYRHTCYKRLQHGTCNVVIENLYLPWKCSKKKQWKSTIGSVFLINAMLHLVALNNNVSNINGWIACRTGVHLTLLFVLL